MQSNSSYHEKLYDVKETIALLLSEAMAKGVWCEDYRVQFSFTKDGLANLLKANASDERTCDYYTKLCYQTLKRIATRLEERIWRKENGE